MAIALEELYIDLLLRTDKYESELERYATRARLAATDIEKKFRDIKVNITPQIDLQFLRNFGTFITGAQASYQRVSSNITGKPIKVSADTKEATDNLNRVNNISTGDRTVRVSTEGTDAIADMESEVEDLGASFADLLNTLNNFIIAPKVDDERLSALNRHLDLKQRHLKETIAYFNTNPITPKINTTQLDKLNALLKQLSTPISKNIDINASAAGQVSGSNQAVSGNQVFEKIASLLEAIKNNTALSAAGRKVNVNVDTGIDALSQPAQTDDQKADNILNTLRAKTRQWMALQEELAIKAAHGATDTKALTDQLSTLAKQIRILRQQFADLNPVAKLPSAYLTAVSMANGGQLPDAHKVPQLSVNDKLLDAQNAQAAYSAEANVIVIKQEMYDALQNIANLTVEQVEALLEEIQHALDAELGSVEGVRSAAARQVKGAVHSFEDAIAQNAENAARAYTYPEKPSEFKAKATAETLAPSVHQAIQTGNSNNNPIKGVASQAGQLQGQINGVINQLGQMPNLNAAKLVTALNDLKSNLIKIQTLEPAINDLNIIIEALNNTQISVDTPDFTHLEVSVANAVLELESLQTNLQAALNPLENAQININPPLPQVLETSITNTISSIAALETQLQGMLNQLGTALERPLSVNVPKYTLNTAAVDDTFIRLNGILEGVIQTYTDTLVKGAKLLNSLPDVKTNSLDVANTRLGEYFNRNYNNIKVKTEKINTTVQNSNKGFVLTNVNTAIIEENVAAIERYYAQIKADTLESTNLITNAVNAGSKSVTQGLNAHVDSVELNTIIETFNSLKANISSADSACADLLQQFEAEINSIPLGESSVSQVSAIYLSLLGKMEKMLSDLNAAADAAATKFANLPEISNKELNKIAQKTESYVGKAYKKIANHGNKVNKIIVDYAAEINSLPDLSDSSLTDSTKKIKSHFISLKKAVNSNLSLVASALTQGLKEVDKIAKPKTISFDLVKINTVFNSLHESAQMSINLIQDNLESNLQKFNNLEVPSQTTDFISNFETLKAQIDSLIFGIEADFALGLELLNNLPTTKDTSLITARNKIKANFESNYTKVIEESVILQDVINTLGTELNELKKPDTTAITKVNTKIKTHLNSLNKQIVAASTKIQKTIDTEIALLQNIKSPEPQAYDAQNLVSLFTVLRNNTTSSMTAVTNVVNENLQSMSEISFNADTAVKLKSMFNNIILYNNQLTQVIVETITVGEQLLQNLKSAPLEELNQRQNGIQTYFNTQYAEILNTANNLHSLINDIAKQFPNLPVNNFEQVAQIYNNLLKYFKSLSSEVKSTQTNIGRVLAAASASFNSLQVNTTKVSANAVNSRFIAINTLIVQSLADIDKTLADAQAAINNSATAHASVENKIVSIKNSLQDDLNSLVQNYLTVLSQGTDATSNDNLISLEEKVLLLNQKVNENVASIVGFTSQLNETSLASASMLDQIKVPEDGLAKKAVDGLLKKISGFQTKVKADIETLIRFTSTLDPNVVAKDTQKLANSINSYLNKIIKAYEQIPGLVKLPNVNLESLELLQTQLQQYGEDLADGLGVLQNLNTAVSSPQEANTKIEAAGSSLQANVESLNEIQEKIDTIIIDVATNVKANNQTKQLTDLGNEVIKSINVVGKKGRGIKSIDLNIERQLAILLTELEALATTDKANIKKLDTNSGKAIAVYIQWFKAIKKVVDRAEVLMGEAAELDKKPVVVPPDLTNASTRLTAAIATIEQVINLSQTEAEKLNQIINYKQQEIVIPNTLNNTEIDYSLINSFLDSLETNITDAAAIADRLKRLSSNPLPELTLGMKQGEQTNQEDNDDSDAQWQTRFQGALQEQIKATFNSSRQTITGELVKTLAIIPSEIVKTRERVKIETRLLNDAVLNEMHSRTPQYTQAGVNFATAFITGVQEYPGVLKTVNAEIIADINSLRTTVSNEMKLLAPSDSLGVQEFYAGVMQGFNGEITAGVSIAKTEITSLLQVFGEELRTQTRQVAEEFKAIPTAAATVAERMRADFAAAQAEIGSIRGEGENEGFRTFEAELARTRAQFTALNAVIEQMRQRLSTLPPDQRMGAAAPLGSAVNQRNAIQRRLDELENATPQKLLERISAIRKEMSAALKVNPQLKLDPAFKQQFAELTAELERIIAEGGDQLKANSVGQHRRHMNLLGQELETNDSDDNPLDLQLRRNPAEQTRYNDLQNHLSAALRAEAAAIDQARNTYKTAVTNATNTYRTAVSSLQGQMTALRTTRDAGLANAQLVRGAAFNAVNTSHAAHIQPLQRNLSAAINAERLAIEAATTRYNTAVQNAESAYNAAITRLNNNPSLNTSQRTREASTLRAARNQEKINAQQTRDAEITALQAQYQAQKTAIQNNIDNARAAAAARIQAIENRYNTDVNNAKTAYNRAVGRLSNGSNTVEELRAARQQQMDAARANRDAAINAIKAQYQAEKDAHRQGLTDLRNEVYNRQEQERQNANAPKSKYFHPDSGMANLGQLLNISPAIDKLALLEIKLRTTRPAVMKLVDGLMELGSAALMNFGLIGGAFAIVQLGRYALDAAIAFEKMRKSIELTAGSQGLKAIENLREQAYTEGLSFRESLSGYRLISAATKNTSLEGSVTESIVETTNTAIASRGLGKEEQNRSFLALAQIASKGKVSLEELNRQLGEALPGALQIAARAFQVTTPELIKMVSSGQVLSEDFIPKFTLQLQSESGLAGAGDTAFASINRLNTAFEDLGATVGSGLLDVIKPLMNGLSGVIKLVVDNAIFLGAVFTTIATRVLGGVFISALISAGGAVIGLIGRLQALNLSAITFTSTWLKLRPILASLASFSIAGLFLGVGTLFKTDETIDKFGNSVQKAIDKLNELDVAKSKAFAQKNGSLFPQKEALFKSIDEYASTLPRFPKQSQNQKNTTTPFQFSSQIVEDVLNAESIKIADQTISSVLNTTQNKSASRTNHNTIGLPRQVIPNNTGASIDYAGQTVGAIKTKISTDFSSTINFLEDNTQKLVKTMASTITTNIGVIQRGIGSVSTSVSNDLSSLLVLIKNTSQELTQIMANNIQTGIVAIKPNFEPIIDLSTNLVQSISEQTVNSFQITVALIDKAIAPVYGAVRDNIAATIQQITNITKSVAGEVNRSVQYIQQVLSQNLESISSTLTNNISSALQQIGSVIKTIGEQTVNSFQITVSLLEKTLEPVVSSIANTSKTLISQLRSVAQTIANEVSQNITVTRQFLIKSVEVISTGVTNSFATAMQQVGSLVSSIGEQTVNSFQITVALINKQCAPLVTGIAENVNEAIKQTSQVIGKINTQLASDIENTVNIVKQGVAPIAKNVVDGLSPALQQVSDLAKKAYVQTGESFKIFAAIAKTAIVPIADTLENSFSSTMQQVSQSFSKPLKIMEGNIKNNIDLLKVLFSYFDQAPNIPVAPSNITTKKPNIESSPESQIASSIIKDISTPESERIANQILADISNNINVKVDKPISAEITNTVPIEFKTAVEGKVDKPVKVEIKQPLQGYVTNNPPTTPTPQKRYYSSNEGGAVTDNWYLGWIDKLAQGTNRFTMDKFNGFKVFETLGDTEIYSKDVKDLTENFEKFNIAIGRVKNNITEIEKQDALKPLRNSIEVTLTALNKARLEGDTTKIAKLTADLADTRKKEFDFLTENVTNKQILTSWQSSLEAVIEKIKNDISADPTRGWMLTPQLNEAETSLQRVVELMRQFDKLVKESSYGLSELVASLAKIDANFTNVKQKLELNKADKAIALSERSRLGERNSVDYRIAESQTGLDNIRNEIKALDDYINQYSKTLGSISAKARAKLEGLIGKKLEEFGAGDIERVLNASGTGEGAGLGAGGNKIELSEPDKTYLNNLKKLQDALLKLRQLQADENNAEYGVIQSEVDAAKSEVNHFREIRETRRTYLKQIEDAQIQSQRAAAASLLETKDLDIQTNLQSIRNNIIGAVRNSSSEFAKSIADQSLDFIKSLFGGATGELDILKAQNNFNNEIQDINRRAKETARQFQTAREQWQNRLNDYNGATPEAIRATSGMTDEKGNLQLGDAPMPAEVQASVDAEIAAATARYNAQMKLLQGQMQQKMIEVDQSMAKFKQFLKDAALDMEGKLIKISSDVFKLATAALPSTRISSIYESISSFTANAKSQLKELNKEYLNAADGAKVMLATAAELQIQMPKLEKSLQAKTQELIDNLKQKAEFFLGAAKTIESNMTKLEDVAGNASKTVLKRLMNDSLREQVVELEGFGRSLNSLFSSTANLSVWDQLAIKLQGINDAFTDANRNADALFRKHTDEIAAATIARDNAIAKGDKEEAAQYQRQIDTSTQAVGELKQRQRDYLNPQMRDTIIAQQEEKTVRDLDVEQQTRGYDMEAAFNTAVGGRRGQNKYEKADYDARSSQLQEMSRFYKQLNELTDQFNSKKINSDEYNQQYFILREISQINLENITSGMEVLRDEIETTVSGSLAEFFTSIFDGTKSAGEAFRDLGRSILSTISTIFAQIAAQKIALAIFSAFTGGGGGGGGDIGAAIGNAVVGSAGGYKDGGEIMRYAIGGEVEPQVGGYTPTKIQRALAREGTGAVLAALTPGEQVLSLQNGDAQFFRYLQSQGLWDSLKVTNNKEVSNFALGGMVGSNNTTTINNVRSQPVKQGRSNITVNMQVNAKDANSFKRSQSMIERDTAYSQRRAIDRNG